jgi:hypothetical protein
VSVLDGVVMSLASRQMKKISRLSHLMEMPFLSSENQSIRTDTADLIAQSLQNAFWDNLKVIRSRSVILYPDRQLQARGVPSPRQYVAFNKLINMVGEDKFKNLPIRPVNLRNDEILLSDQFQDFFPNPHRLKITFASGYFWKTKQERREKMLHFIINTLLPVSESITIYTQDLLLNFEFTGRLKELGIFNECHKRVKVVTIPYRIDIHHIQVEELLEDGRPDPDKSYIFLEYPHTEAFLFRLDTYFRYADIIDFGVGEKELLSYLKELRRWHPVKSTLSFLWVAVNR